MCGRAKAPAAASPNELRSTERRVRIVMPSSFPVYARDADALWLYLATVI
jgi:hypothetical protein